MKQNCWEFMKCERQPGGTKVEKFGVCPAASDDRYNNVYNGKNGGRCCWAIPNTLCTGKEVESVNEKMKQCKECTFFKHVMNELPKEGVVL